MNIPHLYPRNPPASIPRPASPAAAIALSLSLAAQLLATPAFAQNWRVLSREELPSPGAGAALCRLKTADESSTARAEIVCLVFSQRHCRLRVLDRPDPASPRLGQTMQDGGFLCGVNGGFFGKQFEPLGWLVSRGRQISPPQHRARLLSGAFYDDGKRMRLARMTEIRRGLRATEALQAGPFLVDNGAPVPGLDATRPAARTFLATDDLGTWGVGIILSPTLAQSGALLATSGLLPRLVIRRALNLDGGRSTGFWAAQPGGAPLYIEEISSVRNFLAVEARPAD